MTSILSYFLPEFVAYQNHMCVCVCSCMPVWFLCAFHASVRACVWIGGVGGYVSAVKESYRWHFSLNVII